MIMGTKAKVAAPKKEAPKKKTAKGAGKPTKDLAKELTPEAAMASREEMPEEMHEELEEEQDEAEAARTTGGNAAALAAATGAPTELSASFKNFRHHPDMENFYRFIYENDLRIEALTIIDEIIREKQQRKLVKK